MATPASEQSPIRPSQCMCSRTTPEFGPVAETLVAPTVDEPTTEQEVSIEDEIDTESPTHAHDPLQPTARQVAEHRVSHMPFRTWCKHCILGRGRGTPHRRGPGSALPVIGVDYFFMTVKGVKSRKELVEELDADDPITADDADDDKIETARRRGEIVKCVIVRCTLSKALFAHVVPHKGVDEQNLIADMILSDVEWLGHSRIVMKSDGEPAVQALVKRVIELAKVEVQTLEQVSQETSAAYESQSNGSTEVGIQLVRGLFRTLRLCLEERIQKVVPVTHPLTAWLLEHTALLYTAMVRGEDGHTAWGRARGRAFRQQLVGFGESVLFRHPSKGPGHAPDGNMGTLGGEGVFLGYNRAQNTFVVGTMDGRITFCRSISRRPEQQRWNPTALAAIDTLPNYGKSRPAAERVPLRERDAEAQPEDGAPEALKPATLRRMRINKQDLDKYGYDESCGQCKHIQRYGKAQPGKQHSEQCRRRVLEAMSQDDQGRARLRAEEERLDRTTAEHVEHGDRRRQADTDVPNIVPAAREFLDQPAPAPRRVHEPHPRDADIPTPRPAAATHRQTLHERTARGVGGAMGAPPAPLMSCQAKHQKATEGHPVQPQGAATRTCKVQIRTTASTSTWVL